MERREVVRLADLPDGLTVKEAAAVLRLGLNATYQAIGRGELYAVRIGQRLTVPRTEVARLLRVDLTRTVEAPQVQARVRRERRVPQKRGG